MKIIVLHRTFERIKDYQGDWVFYVSSPKGVKKLVGAEVDKWLGKLNEQTTLRLTAAGGFESYILNLQAHGVTVVSAHWHNLDIEKGLPPEQIVERFAQLPDEKFTTVKIRADMLELKNRVNSRFAIMDARKRVNQQMLQIQRSYGLKDKDTNLPQWLKEDKEEAKKLAVEVEDKAEQALLDFARTVPEYKMLSEILGVVSEGFSAAGIVAYIGDPNRFPTVSALWHYAGQHVVDGKAPKRAVGKKQDWNGKLRTVLWTFMDSAIKNNKKWRPVYDEYRAQELAVHKDKCKCKTIEGHCGARARRRVTKDILQLYWVANHPTAQIRSDHVQTTGVYQTKSDKVITKKAA